MDEGSIWRTGRRSWSTRYVPSVTVELGHHMERWLSAIKAQHTVPVRSYVGVRRQLLGGHGKVFCGASQFKSPETFVPQVKEHLELQNEDDSRHR